MPAGLVHCDSQLPLSKPKEGNDAMWDIACTKIR